MRRQKITGTDTVSAIGMNGRRQQRGFSLLMVMAIMVVIALMVIAGSQVSNTEVRISANDADRKHAFSLAEKALQAGEVKAVEYATDNGGAPLDEASLKNLFSVACNTTKGLCLPADGAAVTVPAWERADIFSGNSKDNSIETTVGTTIEAMIDKRAKKPRYIIEYLGVNGTEGRIFRVTTRAWGDNDNTVVTLQSYISTPAS